MFQLYAVITFYDQILGGVMQRRQMLSEVEARHLEIVRLEANIRVSRPTTCNSHCDNDSFVL